MNLGHTMDLNLNALRSPDPGPRDGSILRLQHQHRSREVWEADRTRPVDSKKVRVRSAKKGKPVIENTNLKPYDLCKRLLGEQPTEESKDINGMKVKASWLSDRFTGQVEEGADKRKCSKRGEASSSVPNM
ncbi:hypothetical protein RHGRI_034420 [Rhododendron griersonianum]|uniref:Uncharacterized protein n=1 Tax=Rhododendron griersonianum TaxID=479676 RepID=A0AAV6I3D7_9ERIC|nr:hypothetical protein RHGRI_034420 [Rhododendron griersonianum]